MALLHGDNNDKSERCVLALDRSCSNGILAVRLICFAYGISALVVLILLQFNNWTYLSAS